MSLSQLRAAVRAAHDRVAHLATRPFVRVEAVDEHQLAHAGLLTLAQVRVLQAIAAHAQNGEVAR